MDDFNDNLESGWPAAEPMNEEEFEKFLEELRSEQPDREEMIAELRASGRDLSIDSPRFGHVSSEKMIQALEIVSERADQVANAARQRRKLQEKIAAELERRAREEQNDEE